MRVIAIDPGESTGVAVLDGDELLVQVTVVAPFGVLRTLLRNLHSFEVVYEQPPVNPDHNSDVMNRVRAVVEEEVDRVTYIRPSQWKGHPAAQLAEEDVSSSVHARDAIKLGRWYQHQRRLNVLADPTEGSRPAQSNA